LVVDLRGNVLVPGLDPTSTGYRAVVWRITSTGERSIFAEMPGEICAIALGPDGDIWVSEYATGRTRRLDSDGNIKAMIELGRFVDRLTFSPSGELYYNRGLALYKLENGDTTRVAWPWPSLWTFDRDGYQYVSQNGYFGYNLHDKIVLVDRSRELVVDPVAWVNFPVDMVFARDGTGAPTKRLLVLKYNSDLNGTEIVELNPAGIRAPGP